MVKNYFETVIGVAIAGISIGIGAILVSSAYRGGKAGVARLELEKAKVERGYVPQERDLNENGLLERFYEVNGEKYFLEIDGKNLEETLREEMVRCLQ